VVLVGEEEKLSGNTAQAGCGEGTFCLGVLNAEITLSVNAENGGVPTVDIEVGRSAESFLLLTFGILVPRRSAHVPVGEPKFFCLGVLLLGVVDTVVRNEGFEAFVVVAGQPVDAETAERGTDCAEMFTIHIRFGGNVVDIVKIPGGGNWGGFGMSWSITTFWEKNFNHDSSTVNRRRY